MPKYSEKGVEKIMGKAYTPTPSSRPKGMSAADYVDSLVGKRDAAKAKPTAPAPRAAAPAPAPKPAAQSNNMSPAAARRKLGDSLDPSEVVAIRNRAKAASKTEVDAARARGAQSRGASAARVQKPRSEMGLLERIRDTDRRNRAQNRATMARADARAAPLVGRSIDVGGAVKRSAAEMAKRRSAVVEKERESRRNRYAKT